MILSDVSAGEAAQRYEYYCENEDPTELRNYCTWALKNKHLLKKIDLELDEMEEPRCVFEKVVLKRYRFESQRTFLKCPVLAKVGDEPLQRSSVYISSVENAPSNRLLLYLFGTLRSSQPASVPARPDDLSVSDRDERASVETMSEADAECEEAGVSEIKDHSEATETARSGAGGSRTTARRLSIHDFKPVHESSAATDRQLALSGVAGHAAEDSIPLEIITLLINKRHTLN